MSGVQGILVTIAILIGLGFAWIMIRIIRGMEAQQRRERAEHEARMRERERR